MICKRSIAAASAVILVMIALVMIASTPRFLLAQNGAGPTATRTPMMLPTIPHIQLQPLPGYGPAPLTVGFMATGSDPEGAPFQTFRWNFGDGKVSTLPPTALFHTYTTPGSYVVTLTATTSDGHQASSFAGVIVTPPSQ